SETQPATTNDNDYTKSPYYIEIAMYLYLVLPHEYSQIIHNEPNNMYPPQWMTKKQIDHQKILEEYTTPYDSDEQNNSAEKPNYL
ncbi:18619_t:CDS:2, partial [Dentiscutata erythropus]